MHPYHKYYRYRDIDPDEIFLDSSNLPDHNSGQFEGRVESPVSTKAIFFVGIFFVLVATAFGARALQLQVSQGASFAEISRNNVLESSLIFATRGLIYDRAGVQLAWNELQSTRSK